MPWWNNQGYLQGQAGRQRREQHEVVRALGSWSSVRAGACALRELTASVSGEQQLLKSRRKLRARATPGCRPAFELGPWGRRGFAE